MKLSSCRITKIPDNNLPGNEIWKVEVADCSEALQFPVGKPLGPPVFTLDQGNKLIPKPADSVSQFTCDEKCFRDVVNISKLSGFVTVLPDGRVVYSRQRLGLLRES